MLLEEVVDVGREMGRQADAVDDSADGPAAAVGRGGAVGSLETIVSLGDDRPNALPRIVLLPAGCMRLMITH